MELTAAGTAFLTHAWLGLGQVEQALEAARRELPGIDLVIGYNRNNISPILKLFLSRLDELIQCASSRR